MTQALAGRHALVTGGGRGIGAAIAAALAGAGARVTLLGRTKAELEATAAALPGGALLVLERAYGAGGLRNRLYEVDFAGATDVAALPSLVGATYQPVRKRLLWERQFPDTNYEGAALGPPLSDGGYSLILISDDGHGQRQTLYALVLHGAVDGS